MDSNECLEQLTTALANLSFPLPDEREDTHQLIVLGNGFDLACGLPSRYADFFRGVSQRVFPDPTDTGRASWGEHLRGQGLTAWDVILCNRAADTDWYDVEGEIAKWVIDRPVAGVGRVERVARLMSGLEGSIPGWGDLPADWARYNGGSLRGHVEADVARYLMDTMPDYQATDWDRDSVLAVLLDELHLLESRFMDYLSRAMRESDDYASRATELMQVLEESRSLPDYYRYQVTILNFNYTMPYMYDGRTLAYDTQTINIHGCLEDENAIFGIDGTKCLDDGSALPFTKTYRIMGESTCDVADIVFSPNSEFGRATSLIKFFGHSLNVADYSYFQAIFDIVDLYGGNTTLVFYYRPYDPKDTNGAMAREETMRRVTHLLLEYGKTLDNKDHGKNLVHRLLLEGRLHVQRI